jgi:hypothetical protein
MWNNLQEGEKMKLRILSAEFENAFEERIEIEVQDSCGNVFVGSLKLKNNDNKK